MPRKLLSCPSNKQNLKMVYRIRHMVSWIGWSVGRSFDLYQKVCGAKHLCIFRWTAKKLSTHDQRQV